MSMRDYAVDDYGLLLDGETAKIIASKFADDFEKYANDGTIDWMYEVYDIGICEYISEFTGEAQKVDGTGCYWGVESKDFCHDVIAYVPVSNYPTLFKKAYDDMDELVNEFKSRVGKYLPDDFDYRKHICHISGTYYG